MFPSHQTSCHKIACGKPIPVHTPHAVSVSLPTIADVLAYYQNKNCWRDRITGGYPRFYIHPYEIMTSSYIRKVRGIDSSQRIFLMPSPQCAQQLFKVLNESYPISKIDGLAFLSITETHIRIPDITAYIRLTGSKAYTRQLEDFLVSHHLLDGIHPEDIVESNPEESIKTTLGKYYQVGNNLIKLYSSGMNAIFSIHSALRQRGEQVNRKLLIQFGRVYFDTADILQKFSDDNLVVESVYHLDDLERILDIRGDEVAGIFTEIPTNPYLNTCDLPALNRITRKHAIPLVVDLTLGTPVNLNVLPYCDFVIESLTKFASGTGEVMGGSIVLNQNSPFYSEVDSLLSGWGEPLYLRDAQRLAYTVKGYSLRVTWVCENIMMLVNFLSNHPKVKQVYWSHNDENRQNLSKLERTSNSYIPVISIEFDFPIEKMYNRLQLPKGPSLGPDFTLAIPYFYMAYPNLMRTEENKQLLKNRGVNPEMIRLSIGCEPIQQIIGIFADALDF